MTEDTVIPSANKKVASPKRSRAKAPAPAPEAKAVAKTEENATKVKKEKKEKKPKVIRDSFTLPHDDYAKIAELKQRCLKAGLHVKKSELVRAGLRLLSKLDTTQLNAELDTLERIKTGRPKSA